MSGRAVSASESMTTASEDAAADDPDKRWVRDSAGHKIYYPYGQMRSGYVVTDAARENAICEADRRFDEISKQFKPYASLLVLPVTYAFYYYLGSHPILAFAIFPAFLVLVGLITCCFGAQDWRRYLTDCRGLRQPTSPAKDLAIEPDM
jgi:hypothetical protein